MQYYLYRHVRLDTNMPFYIGVSKKNHLKIKGFNTEYARAFEKTKRTQFWKNVIKKTKYVVEILLESDDKNFILNKEIEFIKRYGKKIDNTGTLVNFSNGGEFNDGHKNRNVSITQLNLAGNTIKIWKQAREISEKTNMALTNIVKCCRHKQLTAYGYKWKYTNCRKYDSIYPSSSRTTGISNNRVGIVILNTVTKEEILCRSQQETADLFHYHRSTIHKYLNGYLTHKFLIFKYKNWIENHTPEAQELGFSINKIK